MAEQSMFWPTTGTGDGTSGGYTSDRLASIWKSVLGDGLLKYLNELEATGTGTTSLAINTGAALVSGYLYENTTSATIATSTLGSGTYGLYVIANESASALTVSRSVSGTSVASKTVRLALNATTPTQPYIKLAVVVTTAGNITSITAETNRWALSRSVSTSNIAEIILGPLSDTLDVPNNTETPLVGLIESSSDFVAVDGTTGIITIKQDGIYAVFVQVTWDTNTTNRRRISIDTVYSTQYAATSIIHTTSQRQQCYAIIEAAAADTFTVDLWQDSGSTRVVSYGYIKVVRM